jgi:hypothetical protein
VRTEEGDEPVDLCARWCQARCASIQLMIPGLPAGPWHGPATVSERTRDGDVVLVSQLAQSVPFLHCFNSEPSSTVVGMSRDLECSCFNF